MTFAVIVPSSLEPNPFPATLPAVCSTGAPGPANPLPGTPAGAWGTVGAPACGTAGALGTVGAPGHPACGPAGAPGTAGMPACGQAGLLGMPGVPNPASASAPGAGIMPYELPTVCASGWALKGWAQLGQKRAQTGDSWPHVGQS